MAYRRTIEAFCLRHVEMRRLSFALDIADDLFAVKPAILDKYFIGVAAGNDHSGEVESGDVAL